MKEIKVGGMSCEHCRKAVTSALEELGLNEVKVDLKSGVAAFAENPVSEEAVREAIDDAGFEVLSVN